MAPAKQPHRIIEVDHVEDGVIVTFATGQSVLFHANFLYASRQSDDNIALTQGDPEAPTPPSRGSKG